MKKRIMLLCSALSVASVVLSVYTLKELKNNNQQSIERYKKVTQTQLKLYERFSSVNLDLPNIFLFFS